MDSDPTIRQRRSLSFLLLSLLVPPLAITAFGADEGPLVASALAPSVEVPGADAPAGQDNSDVIVLTEFVVSSSLAPRRQLDSAAAVTMIDPGQLKMAMPIGLPEALLQLPGVFVTTAGGEGRSNVYARGLPQTGGLVFVGLQQDGMPDISEMQFRNIWQDLLVRPSSFIQRIENVRGGTSGVFMNNVPGGIINLITREGSDTRQGEILVGTSDYNQIKVEAWMSGPLTESTTMAASFAYRRDDGVRNPGYTANKGYVLQGNVLHKFANGRGFVKLSMKWMEDYSTNFTAIPLQDATSPREIPGGFPKRSGIVDSADLRRTVIPNTPLGTLEFDTGKTGPEMATVAGLLEYRFGDAWKIQERVKYTNLVYDSSTLLTSSVATPIQTLVNQIASAAGTQFAAARSGANYAYRLHYPGEGGALVADPTQMNGNGLAWTLTNNATYTFLENYQNDFRLIRTLPNQGALAVGLYNSWIDMPKARTVNTTILTEMRSNPRRLDLELINATTGESLGYATYNGIRLASALAAFRQYSTEQRTLAPFVSYEQQFGNWSIDAGVRYQKKKETMVVANRRAYNINPAGSNIPALRNVGFPDGTYRKATYDISATAWSAGANYKINSSLSAYGRVTSAYRMPISDDFYPSAAAGNSTPAPTNQVDSLEAGIKYATRKLSIFGTLIGSQLKDQRFSSQVAQPDGSLIARDVLRDTDSYGLEIEAIYSPFKELSFRFVGTEQRSSYASDAFVSDPSGVSPTININGKRVTSVPERYSTLTATYAFPEMRMGQLSTDATWRYTGSIMADEANRAEVSGYSIFDAGLSMKSGRFSYRLLVKNVLNSDAIANGDARVAQVYADPTAAYLNARIVLPRSIVGSVSYSF